MLLEEAESRPGRRGAWAGPVSAFADQAGIEHGGRGDDQPHVGARDRGAGGGGFAEHRPRLGRPTGARGGPHRDQRRELLARASHRRRLQRLRPPLRRAQKQGDRGRAGRRRQRPHLGKARVGGQAGRGLEGVLNEALTNLHAAFSNGSASGRPALADGATPFVDEVLDVLRAEWRNDPDLPGRPGPHSAGGRPVLRGAVCDCPKDALVAPRPRGLTRPIGTARGGTDAGGPRAGGIGSCLFADQYLAFLSFPPMPTNRRVIDVGDAARAFACRQIPGKATRRRSSSARSASPPPASALILLPTVRFVPNLRHPATRANADGRGPRVQRRAYLQFQHFQRPQAFSIRLSALLLRLRARAQNAMDKCVFE